MTFIELIENSPVDSIMLLGNTFYGDEETNYDPNIIFLINTITDDLVYEGKIYGLTQDTIVELEEEYCTPGAYQAAVAVFLYLEKEMSVEEILNLIQTTDQFPITIEEDAVIRKYQGW